MGEVRYIKKAVIVEAIPWTGDNEDQVAEFMGVLYVLKDSDEKIVIDTLEGQMRADLGDFIIRGIMGEFYPCKPDIFAMTYDKV